MANFQVRYASRVVIYDPGAFLRLTTNNLSSLFQAVIHSLEGSAQVAHPHWEKQPSLD